MIEREEEWWWLSIFLVATNEWLRWGEDEGDDGEVWDRLSSPPARLSLADRRSTRREREEAKEREWLGERQREMKEDNSWLDLLPAISFDLRERWTH